MPDNTNPAPQVPAPPTSNNMPALPDDAFPVRSLPLSLRVWFDDAMFNRIQTITRYLARATGITPKHLIGKEEACFSVVVDSLNWRLSPYMVARSTFQTPDGKIGYEGKLVGAILEQSGAFVEPPRPEYFGDWSKVLGKFEIVRKAQDGEREKSYPKALYTKADEQGLGVIVRGRLRDEETPREFRLELTQCYPRFSTLWATDPRTQIYYTALRRFASAAVPHLMFGIPFDRESLAIDVTNSAIDTRATPAEPTRAGFARAGADGPVIDHEDTGWEDQSGGDAPERQAQTSPAAPAAERQQAATTKQQFVGVELYDEVGEMVGTFETPVDFLRAFLDRVMKLNAPNERAALLDANQQAVALAADRLGEHPLAAQALEYYAPPARAQPRAEPQAPSLVPPIPRANGKLDVMRWNAALDGAAAQIRDSAIMTDFAAQALAIGTAAGLSPSMLNGLKLRLARYQGDLAKG